MSQLQQKIERVITLFGQAVPPKPHSAARLALENPGVAI